MVVSYRNKRIAIECGGERYHSGETKIRENMERQTILERSGWEFIRIRGSEYYSDKSKTIERIIKDLNLLGIKPSLELNIEKNRSTELYKKVLRSAKLPEDEVFVSSKATLEMAYGNPVLPIDRKNN